MMNADLISLMEKKNNTFEHIFYEMNMYYQSFIMLQETIRDDGDLPYKQFSINVLMESHAIHLRNLMHFFKGTDTINANTVMVNKPKLGISDVDKKTKIIDHTICHLTTERVDSSMDDNNITVRMGELIIEMFPEICDRIAKYLELLSVDSSIQEQYLSEFKKEEIQKQYQELVLWYSALRKAEERAAREGWTDADDLEKELECAEDEKTD